MKVKIFTRVESEGKLQDQINAFLENKSEVHELVDIKYAITWGEDEDEHGTAVGVIHSALIIYR
jgi:hypothetical protein